MIQRDYCTTALFCLLKYVHHFFSLAILLDNEENTIACLLVHNAGQSVIDTIE